MDWDKAIERNEIALLRITSAMFGLLLDARLSGSGLMIPRRVWRSILFLLRPAEAAVPQCWPLASFYPHLLRGEGPEGG